MRRASIMVACAAVLASAVVGAALGVAVTKVLSFLLLLAGGGQ